MPISRTSVDLLMVLPWVGPGLIALKDQTLDPLDPQDAIAQHLVDRSQSRIRSGGSPSRGMPRTRGRKAERKHVGAIRVCDGEVASVAIE